MKIGIIGAGKVGSGLARLLGDRGHEVRLSYATTRERLAAAAVQAGTLYGTVEEAVGGSELVVLATPWRMTLELVRSRSAVLAGKIVWDTTNALREDLSGLLIGTSTSGGEEVARAAPNARVVKAIMPFAELIQAGDFRLGDGRASVFVCGDDASARTVVRNLVADLGIEAVEVGPLAVARYLEPMSMLLVDLAYRQGHGTRVGLSLTLPEPSASDEQASTGVPA